ncbi:hypothetical protein JMJ56_01930 [Belnapia sp. T18]|uniref:Rho termination factor, N-terminal domain n=1 Tax=Belnapia arida TaxID=2804533 RepID=A0ABS1TWB6_9PROT|nr:DUF6496 domain-containing protein [Belnapia arida]MBL6076746.1 hypothetical protein [Belnapia arida]
MAKQSKAQRETVERVMREFKEGDLETSRGAPVRTQRQAVAIALHEAGASRDETPADNRSNLRRTKTREQDSGQTKAALLAEARRRGIPGRSTMDKAALVRALNAH